MAISRWNEKAAWLAAVLALASAAAVTKGLAAQDILHLYVRSPLTDFYRLYLNTGTASASREFLANTFFPDDRSAGAPRVNFPLPSNSGSLRIALGEQPGIAVTVDRLCIERSLLITRCLDGQALHAMLEGTSEATATIRGAGLAVQTSGYRPSLYFGQKLLGTLRPSQDPNLFFARLVIFAACAVFLFCFFLTLSRAAIAWFTLDAVNLFAGAAALRVAHFLLFQPGEVSDSDLFLRYFQFHLFQIPGIRGIVYPAFTSWFGGNRDALFGAQFLLGALSAPLVLLLIRSFKPASRWDLVWALIATSLPVLLAMESLILSESLALFLLLTILVCFRWLQKNERSLLSAAGLGAACALLAHTKPQFGFVAFLLAFVLLVPRLWPQTNWQSSVLRVAAFAAPVLALQLLALSLNFSYGNFAGTSSTLGYSLFDHGQQSIVCPTVSPDPYTQFYCEARAALGEGGDPYAYTAWVIYPAMHRLHQPFPLVTARYADLSIRLIAHSRGLYAKTVWKSFVTFWTAEIPMARNVSIAGARNGKATGAFMNALLFGERLFRDAIALSFFAVLIWAAVRRIRYNTDAFLFCGLMVAIVLCSSVLQALLESGRENARFAIPTEPLLTMTVVYVAARLLGDTRDF